jgi:hypothetical protein
LFSDEPTGKAVEKGVITGIWFGLETIRFGVYVPIEPMDNTLDLPEGPLNPLEPLLKMDVSDRLLKLQRDLSILIQMVRWLYNIYRLKYPGADPYVVADEFFSKYVKEVEPLTEDSALDYDFYNLPRAFPYNHNNIQDALEQLNETAPTLSNGNELMIYGNGLYEKIKESLDDYIDRDLEVIVPQYIANYYMTENDYPYMDGNIVFLSNEAIDAWMKRAQVDQSGAYPIYNKLKIVLKDQELSYIYQPTQGTIFLIRNVPITQGKKIALNVALNWKKNRINSVPTPLIDVEEGYQLLTISSDEGLSILSDEGGDLMILNYPNSSKYAAILPLHIN